MLTTFVCLEGCSMNEKIRVLALCLVGCLAGLLTLVLLVGAYRDV